MSAASGKSGPTPPGTGPAAAAGILLLVGVALPLGGGLLGPVLALVLCVGLVVFRDALSSIVLAHTGGSAGLAARHGARIKILLVVSVAGPASVLAAAACSATASLFMQYPAALWGVGAAIVTGAVGSRLLGARGSVGAVIIALLTVGAAVLGTQRGDQFEQAGPDARGYAQSGPILGIHPFQITAVSVDGYGPFDIPFNDYVEPDASRGYGAPELAQAFELALHTIARQQFQGVDPAAYAAFSGVSAQPVTTQGVRERLDKPAEFEHQPRFVVRSGTYGPRSRVEFSCPGQRNDPRGQQPDNIMVKMCPDKYAAEASAGLGLTGRWAGYAEGRGNARTSVSRWLGYTRSDDEVGQLVSRWERRALALLALALLAFLTVRGGRRDARRGAGLQFAAAAGVILVLGGLLAHGLSAPPSVRVPLHQVRAPWDPALQTALLVPLLAIASLWSLLPAQHASGPARTSALRAGVVFGGGTLMLGTLWAAGSLPLTQQLRPDLFGTSAPPFTQMVDAVAGVLSALGDVPLQLMAAHVATAFALVLLGLVHGALGAAARWFGHAAEPTAGPGRPSKIAMMAVVVVAGCLVLSRKTAGGSTLLPGAIAVLAVLPALTLRLASPSGTTTARAGGILLALSLVFGLVQIVLPFVEGAAPAALLVIGSGLALLVLAGAAMAGLRPGQAQRPSDQQNSPS